MSFTSLILCCYLTAPSANIEIMKHKDNQQSVNFYHVHLRYDAEW